MPSPIAHTVVGYALFQIAHRYWPEKTEAPAPKPLPLLIGAVGFTMLPDLDAVVGILVGDIGRFHNQGMHSLLVGLGIAVMVGVISWFAGRQDSRAWFVLALAAYGLHILMDYFTIGRGVMLFWPLTESRFLSPVALFYGLRWSHGLFSSLHLWTIFTEGVFAAVLIFIVHALFRNPFRLQDAVKTLRISKKCW